MTAPARTALERAATARARTGTENHGFVSEDCGLLPIAPPLRALPSSHRAWDDMAARLPELFRSVTGREALEAMPLLDAGEDALPDAALLRAASLLGHFAHTYVRVRPDPPGAIPPSIREPWATVCRRLGRNQTVLTYDDLIASNWRALDPASPSRRLENLAVLTPTVGNAEERIFYMVQVEAHARAAPAIGAMARAQEAVLAGDEAALAREVALLIDLLEACVQAFLKIDANPHSPTYVNPVVWAKTVAPFAVAIAHGQHAISGAAAPIFQVLDVFVGRRHYQSRVGREAHGLRPGFSPALRDYMHALEALPVAEAVASMSPRVRGLWHSLLEAYSGDRGFLGVHRRKAYGFLEIAFKVGRSVTTGGFSGLFEDQTWDVADRELEASRAERWQGQQAWCPVAHPRGGGALSGDGLAHLHLDVSEAGLRARPGDRLAIVPRNPPDAVARTLRALRATGEESVGLDSRWRAALGTSELPLRDLIDRGRIRPMDRVAAKALLAFSESERLARIVHARAESAWELWDLLEHMAGGGFDARALWRADPWEPHAMARLVPPLEPRLYSLSSSLDGDPATGRVELLAAELRYEQPASDVAPACERTGTASSYLRRLAATPEDAPLAVALAPASRFRLPEDPRRPVVMFAGGAGMSPFRAFIAARSGQPDAGLTWLLLSTRSERHRDLYARDAQAIRFDAVVTGARPSGSGRRGIAQLIDDHADALRELALAGDAVFYVCGSAGFAAAVTDALEALVSRPAVRAMIGAGRLQQDVFTSAERPAAADVPVNASEVAERNDDNAGYWTIIDGGVYDVTEFSHRHPGGAGILREVAGRDGSAAYRQIEHHRDPEVQAMIAMYRVGTIRRLDLGRRGAVAIGARGLEHVVLLDLFRAWVRYLHLVVEVQNAVRHDFGVLDAVTVGGDEPGRMTFLKGQMLLEAHRRFADVYLAALLGRELMRLWALSTAFVSPGTDVRELGRALRARLERPGAQAAAAGVAAACERLRCAGRADPAARERMLAGLASARTPLASADLTLLASLKAGAASGVRLFEHFERDVLEHAHHGLLGPLRTIPGLVANLDDAIAAATVGNDAFAALAPGAVAPPALT